jgi:RNA polymerase sigma-70 factor (ECF subfamily)
VSPPHDLGAGRVDSDQKISLSPTSTGVQQVRDTPEPLRKLSFSEVFHDHGPYLWRVLLSLGVSESDVEDLCQEVMLVVHRKLDEFEGSSVRSWLYGIGLRIAANHRRSARVRHEVVTDRVPDRIGAANQPQQLEAARLLAVLDQLDDDKRIAFVLHEVEQLTLREVAEATDVPMQTAYSRLQAARDFVRQAFAADAPPKGGTGETG